LDFQGSIDYLDDAYQEQGKSEPPHICDGLRCHHVTTAGKLTKGELFADVPTDVLAPNGCSRFFSVYIRFICVGSFIDSQRIFFVDVCRS
jgi:hypothetical protein